MRLLRISGDLTWG
jgi:hypothetical protein